MKKALSVASIMREQLAANSAASFGDVLKALPKGTNKGTAQTTFYKLRASKGRKVRRVRKPVAGEHDGLLAAIAYVRSCGSVEAARQGLESVASLIEQVKEL